MACKNRVQIEAQTFLSGSVFEFGRVNGMDPNVIRVLAEKYKFEVSWKYRGNKNVGFSPLDDEVWMRYTLFTKLF